jgi:hypothetical protein
VDVHQCTPVTFVGPGIKLRCCCRSHKGRRAGSCRGRDPRDRTSGSEASSGATKRVSSRGGRALVVAGIGQIFNRLVFRRTAVDSRFSACFQQRTAVGTLDPVRDSDYS